MYIQAQLSRCVRSDCGARCHDRTVVVSQPASVFMRLSDFWLVTTGEMTGIFSAAAGLQGWLKYSCKWRIY